MATSTLTKRLLTLAAKNGTPKGTNSDLFDVFIRAATPQIRTAFWAKHSEAEVFEILGSFFKLTQTTFLGPGFDYSGINQDCSAQPNVSMQILFNYNPLAPPAILIQEQV